MIKIILMALVRQTKRFLKQQHLKCGVESVIITFKIFLTEVVLYLRITTKNEVIHNKRTGDFILHY